MTAELRSGEEGLPQISSDRDDQNIQTPKKSLELPIKPLKKSLE